MNKKQLIIVDNFYDNVDKVREFVLKQDFDVKGNYPGARTKSFKSEEIKKTFERIIGKKINYWPDTYNGSFQYTTEKMRSWIHRDLTTWAGVIYLTPNAPLEGGTAFFRHKETGIEDKKGYDKLSKEKKRLVDNDGNDISKWDMIDRVANKYNRLILFRGMRNHSSMKYFGKDKTDGRLFQTWFFNVDENSCTPTIPPLSIDTIPPVPKSTTPRLPFDKDKIDYFLEAEKLKKEKKWSEAIKNYNNVIEKETDPEKVYWSHYSVGVCTEELEGFEKARTFYLKSYYLRNTRLEGIYRVVKYYREKEMNKECFALGIQVLSKGVNLVAPNELFVDKSIYEYGFIFEISIAAYTLGKYKLSHDLTKKIIDQKKYPSSLSQLLKNNIELSMNKMKNSEILKKQSPKAPTYSESKDKIILIYQYFLHQEEERRKEITKCLKLNVENQLIDHIVLLNEKIYTNKELGVESDKIQQINIKDRLKFSHVFEYVEKEKLKGYIITCNADIFFDKSLENLYVSGMDRNKIMYGQLRFEYDNKDLDKCRLFGPRNDSQDTWIFHSNYNISLNQREIFNFHYGVGGCDNRVLHNFHSLGFTIINDPYFVKTYHNHKAPMKSRDWIHKPLTPRPYLYMNPYLKSNEIVLFWQYPVITEKTFYLQNKGKPNFLGLPWATIIDKNINLQIIYNLLKSQGIIGKKYYTCCQHVHFRKILPFLKLIGIETVYSPHKVLGEDRINGIEIKPCPLYPVNVEDPERNGKMKDVDLIEKKRPFLYSFAGGWQKDYLTDIRPRIFKLHDPNRKDIYIRNTGDWHFNRVVYNSKQNKDGELNEDSTHKQKTQEYLELLLKSRFTLAPSGTGPNSIRFWEAIGAGSIPVLLADTLELPKHELWKEAIVFLPEKDLEKIEDILAEISPEKEKDMRKNCLKLYNYFKDNYANNSDKVIVHYCCGSYDEGAVGGVARYDYHIKCAFPERIFVKQKDPKLLELCKKYGSRLIVITDNHLACDVPNDITTYLVHHGCALTTAKRNPNWNKLWKDLCVEGQNNMLSYRDPNTTTIISISKACTDDFIEYFGEEYTKFKRIDLLHSSELDENRYIKTFHDKPRVLGNWKGLKKGEKLMPKLIEKAKDFVFNQLSVGIKNGDIEDFNRRKQDIYLDNDIFLQISNSEGNSYASLDALICGMVVVASNVGLFYGDVPEDCFVKMDWTKNNDPDYVYSRLKYAWENREEISRKGREWYMKNYRFDSWKTKIRNIVGLVDNKNNKSPIITMKEYNNLKYLVNTYTKPCTIETQQCFKNKYNTPVYGKLYNNAPIFECCKEKLTILYNKLLDISEKNNFSIFLIDGSLLGCLRNNKHIPYDPDIDVGLLKKDLPKFIDSINELEEGGHKVVKQPGLFMYNFSKINNIHIDILIFELDNQNNYISSKYTKSIPKYLFKKQDLLPFTKQRFENRIVNIPNNSIKFIEDNYGKHCIKNPLKKINYDPNYLNMNSTYRKKNFVDLPNLNYWDKIVKYNNKLLKLGTNYGGWYVPNQMNLNSDSIIYSAGVGEDISFDLLLSSQYNSKIFLIDPTPRSLTHFNEIKDGYKKNSFSFTGDIQVDYNKYLHEAKPNFNNFEYLQIGLWDEKDKLKFYKPKNSQYVSHSLVSGMTSEDYIEVETKTIKDIMVENNHKHIDLLKLDIEGAEIKVINNMLDNKIYPTYVLIEFDLKLNNKDTHNETEKLVNRLLKNYNLIKNDNWNITFEKKK